LHPHLRPSREKGEQRNDAGDAGKTLAKGGEKENAAGKKNGFSVEPTATMHQQRQSSSGFVFSCLTN
jgi:hypothetical protein